MLAEAPTPLLVWFDRHFSVRLPFTRFARNTVLLSLIGLAPVLALYITLTPGFWGHLLTEDSASARFLRQILTNGLPVVCVVNAISLVLFARLRSGAMRPGLVLSLDIPGRLLAFIALHAVIYPASALMFGSFGGDPVQALRVVGPTLGQAGAFGNLSGVYLYATLATAMPLHTALVDNALRQRGYRASLASLTIPALAILLLQVLVLTLAARLLL